MAAGLGFKDFTTGEVLTAADVDGYLMQGIWVFASTAARDAAVTAPAEGNFAFTKDTNSLWYYDGAAWVASGATGDIEGVTAGTGISGGGTSGTVTITNSMATAIDAKGDLVVGTGADAFSRLAVGTNNYVLTADSAEATGLKWAAASSSSGPAFFVERITSPQSVTLGATTKVQFNGEVFDTDNCFDSTTNYRFTPNKSGYYQINANVNCSSGSLTVFRINLYKNGSYFLQGNDIQKNADAYAGGVVAAVMYFNGSSDYVEVFAAPGGSGTGSLNTGTTTHFSGVWIRS